MDDLAVGTVTFNDGSSYTGTLLNGIPDGLGTCTWVDGNSYDGEWKNGTMHGFGTFLWTSGQRFDGEWRDGRRDGVGVKKYSDGSTFDGLWKDGKKHGVGLFRPHVATAPQIGTTTLLQSGSFRMLPQGLRFGRDSTGEGLGGGGGGGGWKEGHQREGDDSTFPTTSAVTGNERRSPSKRQTRGDSPPPPLQEGGTGPRMVVQGQGGSGGQGGGTGPRVVVVGGEAPLVPRSISFRGQAKDLPLSTESVVAGPAIPPKKKDVYIRKFEDGKLIREDKLDKVRSIDE